MRRLLDRLPEWSENWRAFPHCNGQARCWTHTDSRWCACACPWCRIARVARRYHRNEIHEKEQS